MDQLPEGLILDAIPGSTVFATDVVKRFGLPVPVLYGPINEACPVFDLGSCQTLDSAHGAARRHDLDRPDHRVTLYGNRRHLTEDRPIVVIVRPVSTGLLRARGVSSEGWVPRAWGPTTSSPSLGERPLLDSLPFPWSLPAQSRKGRLALHSERDL